MTNSNSFGIYSVILLNHANEYLLLQRATTKQFAPNRWTGIGGSVEPEELNNLRASALRELQEETNILEAEVDNFTLRRVLLHARMNDQLTMLLYFTGSLDAYTLPECTEGMLAWIAPTQLSELDIIESTRPVLPLLIEDMQRDPTGLERTRLGVAYYHADEKFDKIHWAQFEQSASKW
jgi:8-oxo-dGTP diphosphatase